MVTLAPVTQRIMGLETEYVFELSLDGIARNPLHLFNWMFDSRWVAEVLWAAAATRTSNTFLSNGGRLYPDESFPEYATA